MSAIEKSYNFRRINDRITTSGVVPEPVLSELGNDGIEAVINLLPADSEYAVANEADLVSAQQIAYEYLPVDFDNPTAEDFRLFSEAMDKYADKSVHVHCAANWRVSAFYSAWAIGKGHMTAEQADELINGLWTPAEHEPWPAFISAARKA